MLRGWFHISLFALSLLAVRLGCVAQIAAPGSASGNQLGVIEGTVTTSDNHPVANASVRVQNASGRDLTSTYSKFDGSFEVQYLASGQYRIIVQSKLDEVTENVQLTSSRAWVNLTLPKESVPESDRRGAVSVAQLAVPAKARNMLEKAYAAIRKQKPEEALDYIGKTLAIFPKYADAFSLRATLELHDNDQQKALSDADQAIQADPNCGLAYLVLGSVYNSLKQFDDAIRALERGIAITPHSWGAYFEMSRAQIGKGNFPSAIRNAEKASSLAPEKNSALHLLKANAYMGLKDHSAAMAELRAYLKEEPSGRYAIQARQQLEQIQNQSSQ